MPLSRLYQTELVESFRRRRWDAAVVRCADDGENDAAVEWVLKRRGIVLPVGRYGSGGDAARVRRATAPAPAPTQDAASSKNGALFSCGDDDTPVSRNGSVVTSIDKPATAAASTPLVTIPKLPASDSLVILPSVDRPQPEFVIPDAAYLGAPAPLLSFPCRWPRVASTGARQWQGCHTAWLSPVAPLSSSLSAAVALLLLVGGRWARSSCGVFAIGFF
ncbi:hypothetical protein OsI_25486 [Oryza sativa Indica Group]|uniref:Uncharacterized protein n=1 Tax=Oryza sativa subsp. indica TaxID=39946 RepID=B8B4Q3_ORYSI|nr:hypothetical protein OsI_25486 [Oryza sativa Indica Group]